MVGVDFVRQRRRRVAARWAPAQLGARNVKAKGPLVSAQVPVGSSGPVGGIAVVAVRDARAREGASGLAGRRGKPGRCQPRLQRRPCSDRAGRGGVTVGVLSDSYNCNPATVRARRATDHGPRTKRRRTCRRMSRSSTTARARLRRRAWHGAAHHDVAPGAAQKFHTASNSLVDFADGILELQGRDPT